MYEKSDTSCIRLDNHDNDTSQIQPIINDSPQLMSIGGGMFIPIRNSSLRKNKSYTTSTATIRHSFHHASHRNIDSIRNADIDEETEEQETETRQRQISKERRLSKSLQQSARLQQPLETPPLREQCEEYPRQDKHENEDRNSYNQHVKPLPLRPENRYSDGIAYTTKPRRHSPPRRIVSETISKPQHQSAQPPSTTNNKPTKYRSSRMSTKSAPPLETTMPTEDRPSTSSSSINDSVQAYLCSPRLSQKIRDPLTNRVISFSEVGDPSGHAVFVCVGMGLTRYITAFYDELALTLKLRLITPDRPGVGESSAHPNNTTTSPLNWPDDIASISRALQITHFTLLAHSAGAIYALATALRMPDRIVGKIHLLAPWIPPSQLNVISSSGQQTSPPTNSMPTSQRILRALPAPLLKVANSTFLNVTSASVTTSLPRSSKKVNQRKSGGGTTASKDLKPSPTQPLQIANIDDPPPPATPSSPTVISPPIQSNSPTLPCPDYDAALTSSIWTLSTLHANPHIDLLICLERFTPIGFRYVDIVLPVIIHHGSKDTRVPVGNVRWLARAMRDCELRVVEGEGHGLMASAGVMGGVLVEIGREGERLEKAGAKRRDGGVLEGGFI